jgi:V/A-type H+-transporting ATPase subunit A
LQRIVNLVGVEALSSEQRWTLESPGLIKEGLLQQSATDEIDSFASPEKQFALLAGDAGDLPPGHEAGEARRAGPRLIQMPLLAQARRWKSQHKSEEIAALKAKIAAIRANSRWGQLRCWNTSRPRLRSAQTDAEHQRRWLWQGPLAQS